MIFGKNKRFLGEIDDIWGKLMIFEGNK